MRTAGGGYSEECAVDGVAGMRPDGVCVVTFEVAAGLPLERVRSNGYVFQVEMTYVASRLGYKFKEIPIYFADRRWGKSKMSFRIQIEAALRVWLLPGMYRDIQKKVTLS